MTTGKRKGGRKKGTPKTGGRKKGTPNKATVEAKQAAAAIVDNPKYRAKLEKRAIAGKLAPAVETMLWHYAKGKPKEIVELDLNDRRAIEQLSDAELVARGLALADELRALGAGDGADA